LIRNITSLGQKEAKLLINLRAQGKLVFSFKEAQRILGDSPKRVGQLIYALVKKHWLERLEKGKYLILPFEAGEERAYTTHEFVIAANLTSPYYIGFRSALNFYGLTEQVSKTVYVATLRQKKELKVGGAVFRFVKVPEKKYFGVTQVTLQEEKVNISDLEKTIIDCLDHPEYAGGLTEVAKAIWFGREDLDLSKLVAYTDRFDEKALAQRLGFLLEFLEVADENILKRLAQLTGKAYVKLDLMGGEEGKYLAKWRLKVNLPKEGLTEWQRY